MNQRFCHEADLVRFFVQMGSQCVEDMAGTGKHAREGKTK